MCIRDSLNTVRVRGRTLLKEGRFQLNRLLLRRNRFRLGRVLLGNIRRLRIGLFLLRNRQSVNQGKVSAIHIEQLGTKICNLLFQIDHLLLLLTNLILRACNNMFRFEVRILQNNLRLMASLTNGGVSKLLSADQSGFDFVLLAAVFLNFSGENFKLFLQLTLLFLHTVNLLALREIFLHQLLKRIFYPVDEVIHILRLVAGETGLSEADIRNIVQRKHPAIVPFPCFFPPDRFFRRIFCLQCRGAPSWYSAPVGRQ